MSRLTKKFDSGVGYNECHGSCMTCNGAPCELAQAMIDKLAHYEDIEEHGRLIELPCAVGDTVYLISSQYSECSKHQERFNDYNCQGCEDECDSHKEYFIHVNENMSAEWIVRAMRLNRFGKTVFTTREEAEAKLKEMEGAE